MQVAVSDAKGRLLDLVRRAERGEDIVMTRHGRAIVRLVGMKPGASERRAALEQALGAGASTPGASAAQSQDFLYDGSGLPG